MTFISIFIVSTLMKLPLKIIEERKRKGLLNISHQNDHLSINKALSSCEELMCDGKETMTRDIENSRFTRFPSSYPSPLSLRGLVHHLLISINIIIHSACWISPRENWLRWWRRSNTSRMESTQSGLIIPSKWVVYVIFIIKRVGSLRVRFDHRSAGSMIGGTLL